MSNMVRDAGFGSRDTVKGMVPGHICIVKVCFTQVWFSKVWFGKVWFSKAWFSKACHIQDT